MTEENNRWREKYRSALNQQEQLEKTLAAQQGLLHRTVLAMAAAAEGCDTEVDKRLSAIRSSLKNNDVGGFDRMLKSLPRVVEEADKRQQKQWENVGKSLGSIADQLQDLAPNSHLKPAIKTYKKHLPKGILLPTTVTRLLEEFGHLQTQALEGTTEEKSGFMQRLFKGKEAPNTTEEAESFAENETEEAQWEEVQEQGSAGNGENEVITAEVVDHTPQHRERSIPEAVHQRPLHEPAFSRISSRITIILIELLEHFPSVPCVEQKAVKARERIERGLNWYELAPTLEDVRDFVIQSYIGADNDYRCYLANVHAELNHITSALGLAIESEQKQRTAANHLHADVTNGVETIQKALSDNQEINQLKNAVETQVQSIQGALTKFTQENSAEENPLSSQLTQLIEKVKMMEQQDAAIREELEQEKTRAITDSLTGLPNREAYSVKIHEEMLRWQRYQHPLTLAVLDIDFFKKINDNYGHHTGDKVLKVVSKSVAKRLREVDFIARFGGEEFIILLPETSAENALGMLNRIRERLANTPLRHQEEKITVTVSMGISEFADDDTAETVFERADKALYDAKEGGRNQCCLGVESPPAKNQ